MSVLVYTETEDGKCKKAAFEVASYAKEVAGGDEVVAVSFNATDASELGKYGVSKVLNIQNDKLGKFNAEAYADALTQAAKKEGSKIIVVSQSANRKGF